MQEAVRRWRNFPSNVAFRTARVPDPASDTRIIKGARMFLSVFDIFKIGIGPSSSHTIGPMVAAARFLEHLRGLSFSIRRVSVTLHGSLAFTGVGHATDRAVILGLCGMRADDFDEARAAAEFARVSAEGTIHPTGLNEIAFAPRKDLIFDYGPALSGHANGLVMRGYDGQGDVLTEVTYYSIGGGFVVTSEELAQGAGQADQADFPYPFKNAKQMLEMAKESGKSIAAMKRANELVLRPEIDTDLSRIWQVMSACIDRGLSRDGILPGGLNVRRRAKGIHEKLLAERGMNLTAPHVINDWMSVYAMAVNEENAAGGQVVTAPTNGAAGVVPATIRYWLDHVPGADRRRVGDFLLTAAAIGGIIKTNASISGAECGCQAEVGSAAAMAAAGLAAVLGGTPEQIENAAEIALEHHLGMTCDPIRGLVQVPCIERNGLGAIKAVSAASLALRGDGQHLVPLDAAIETMRQTGNDMSEKYKETALGGLAVNVPNC